MCKMLAKNLVGIFALFLFLASAVVVKSDPGDDGDVEFEDTTEEEDTTDQSGTFMDLLLGKPDKVVNGALGSVDSVTDIGSQQYLDKIQDSIKSIASSISALQGNVPNVVAGSLSDFLDIFTGDNVQAGIARMLSILSDTKDSLTDNLKTTSGSIAQLTKNIDDTQSTIMTLTSSLQDALTSPDMMATVVGLQKNLQDLVSSNKDMLDGIKSDLSDYSKTMTDTVAGAKVLLVDGNMQSINDLKDSTLALAGSLAQPGGVSSLIQGSLDAFSSSGGLSGLTDKVKGMASSFSDAFTSGLGGDNIMDLITSSNSGMKDQLSGVMDALQSAMDSGLSPEDMSNLMDQAKSLMDSMKSGMGGIVDMIQSVGDDKDQQSAFMDYINSMLSTAAPSTDSAGGTSFEEVIASSTSDQKDQLGDVMDALQSAMASDLSPGDMSDLMDQAKDVMESVKPGTGMVVDMMQSIGDDKDQQGAFMEYVNSMLTDSTSADSSSADSSSTDSSSSDSSSSDSPDDKPPIEDIVAALPDDDKQNLIDAFEMLQNAMDSSDVTNSDLSSMMDDLKAPISAINPDLAGVTDMMQDALDSGDKPTAAAIADYMMQLLQSGTSTDATDSAIPNIPTGVPTPASSVPNIPTGAPTPASSGAGMNDILNSLDQMNDDERDTVSDMMGMISDALDAAMPASDMSQLYGTIIDAGNQFNPNIGGVFEKFQTISGSVGDDDQRKGMLDAVIAYINSPLATSAAPGSLVPASPGSALPASPGSALPASPGSAIPASPGSAIPASPGSAIPASPGSALPASPGSALPASPGSALPASPGSALPASPGSALPASPGSALPASPGPAPPAYAGFLSRATSGSIVPASSGSFSQASAGSPAQASAGSFAQASSGSTAAFGPQELSFTYPSPSQFNPAQLVNVVNQAMQGVQINNDLATYTLNQLLPPGFTLSGDTAQNQLSFVGHVLLNQQPAGYTGDPAALQQLRNVITQRLGGSVYPVPIANRK